MATQRQTDKVNKKPSLRDVFQKYSDSREGQFLEATGGGVANNDDNELGDGNFSITDKLSPDFKPRLSDEEYLNLLNEFYDDEEEIQGNQLKPVEEMTQEEILIEIRNRVSNLKNKKMEINGPFFENDLALKLGCLRQLDLVTEKYGINFDEPFIIETINNPKEAVAFVNSGLSLQSSKNGTFFSISSKRIVFNTSDMANIRATKRMLEYEQNIGEWVKTSDSFYPESIACHECGHIVCNSIFTQMSERQEFKLMPYLFKYKMGVYGDPDNDDKTKISPLQLMVGDIIKNEIIERVYEIYITDNPDLGRNDFDKDTSSYGQTLPQEWFAETFASMNGGTPSKSALALKKWLDGFYNFNGGNK